MYEFLLFLFLVVAIALIGLILIQHGKGADMGASFGSGASGTVFGAPGAGNFLTKSTSFLAMAFFAIALTLAYLTSNGEEKVDGFWGQEKQVEEVPVTEPAKESDIPVVDEETNKESDIPTGDVPVETKPVESKETEKKSENTETVVEDEGENKDNSGDK